MYIKALDKLHALEDNEPLYQHHNVQYCRVEPVSTGKVWRELICSSLCLQLILDEIGGSGPKHSCCFQAQVLYNGPGGWACEIRCITTAPMGDCFFVLVQTVSTAEGDARCRLKSSMQVSFKGPGDGRGTRGLGKGR